VSPPLELQLGWLIERWGAGTFDLDFKLLMRAERALDVFHLFRKEMKDRTEEDWTAVKKVLAEIEEWKA
jgi:hypothetical protein